MPYTFDSTEFDRLVAENPGAKKILAEGDSWLAYPPRFVVAGPASNIVAHLAHDSNLIIYSTASNGDEAVAMISGRAKHALMKRIRANRYDFLLFSGGGNDIVGNFDFDFLLRTYEPGMTAMDCVNAVRLNRKLDSIRYAYEELIERTKEYSLNPNIKIVTHTYDIPIPSNEGARLFDIFPIGKAWMGPFFGKMKINDPTARQVIVKHIMESFRTMLLDLQKQYNTPAIELLRVVDTHGAVPAGEWLNEIHPTPRGFEEVTNRIKTALT